MILSRIEGREAGIVSNVVGESRARTLARLLEHWQRVVHGDGPRFVHLQAPMGWGKTRIVQEFYRAIAEAQHEPSYWPASILDDTVEVTTPAQLGDRRKRIMPGPFRVERGAHPEFLWLGVHAEAADALRPAEIYRDIVEQLRQHLVVLLRRRTLTQAAKKMIRRSLSAFLPIIPADLEDVLDAGEILRDFVKDVVGDGGVGRRIYEPDAQEQAARLFKLMATVWGEDGDKAPPLVLVIEDCHFMSAASVELVRSILASRFPVLLIATGWPPSSPARPAERAFAAFLDQAPGAVFVERLDALSVDEMLRLVDSRHPGTSQRVLRAVVDRCGGNPYALLIMLVRARAVPGRPVPLSVDEAHARPFGLDALFVELFWDLDDETRRQLAAASLIGQRFPRAVSRHAALAARVGPELSEALGSGWLRPDAVSGELLAFLEPLRHEVAHRNALDEWPSDVCTRILEAALVRLRQLLEDNVSDPDRSLLWSLHLRLGQQGVESDFAALLASTEGLLNVLRPQSASGAITEVVARFDAIADRLEATNRLTARWSVVRARHIRLSRIRGHETTRAAVDRALTDTSAHGVDPLDRIQALLDESRLTRNPDVPDTFDLARCRSCMNEAMSIAAGLRPLPRDLEHQLLGCSYALLAAEGDRLAALQLALEARDHMRSPDGSDTSMSLESLADAAYYAARIDVASAVPMTRELVTARVEYWGSERHPRVATAKKDLAVRLAWLHTSDAAEEAFEVACDAYATLLRAGGPEDRHTLLAASARSYAACQLAIHGPTSGRLVDARALVEMALSDARTTLEIRQREAPNRNFPVIKERVALARSLAGEQAALDDLLDSFEGRLRRGQTWAYGELRVLAKDIQAVVARIGSDEQLARLTTVLKGCMDQSE